MSALLEVRDLTVRFRSKTALRALVERDRHPWIEAVCDVSFSIGEGETMALVGESGSGKTTLARAIIGLVEPAAGSIRFSGCERSEEHTSELQSLMRISYAVFCLKKKKKNIAAKKKKNTLAGNNLAYT